MSAESPDLAAIASALGAALPMLGEVGPLRLLDSGFGSIVVETPGALIFRLPRHRYAAAGQRREAHLLPRLAPWLPLPIPLPAWFAEPTPGLPFGASGYRKLVGEPLIPARLVGYHRTRLAQAVAAFLVALHGIPVGMVADLGLPGPEGEQGVLAELRVATAPTLRAALSRAEYGRVARWWEILLAEAADWHYTPMLCHNDLWYGNVVIEPATNMPCGILDFEAVAFGDPAQDFATQRHLGRAFCTSVIMEYRALGGIIDADLPHRLTRRWELREIGGLRLALAMGDATEVAETIEKIRRGPILHPDRDRGTQAGM